MSDPIEPAYRLTFEPTPQRPDQNPPAPVAVRLRRLLKHAGRVLQLRCTLVEKLEAPPPAPPSPAARRTRRGY